MRNSTHMLCLAWIVSLSVLTENASAAPVTDQEFDPTIAGVGASQGLWSLTTDGQTFTVGLGGALTGFDLYLSNSSLTTPPNDIGWEIQTTTGGLPDGTALSSGVLLFGDIPVGAGFVHVDLAAGVAVAPGDVLAIVLNGTSIHPDPVVRWSGSIDGGATYVDGEGLKLRFTGWGPSVIGRDIDWGFRTFVDTTAVPEPGSAALLLLGVAAVWPRRRVS